MNLNTERITPVLLGGDLNAYSMATSFALAEGVASIVFARERLAATDLSSYINLHVVNGLDDCNTAVPVLLEFAGRRIASGEYERPILVPCADWYMEMLEYARDALAGHFYFHIPDFEVWRTVSDKSSFTRLCDKYSIPHPKTEIFDSKFTDFQKRGARLRPPFVLKPSDSSEYWRCPFHGMKKVYFPHSLDEARRIGEKIYASGYSGKLLLQEYISDACACVLTTYSSRDGKVKRAVLGDVLLEERGPTARGNYSAIVTRRLDEISYSLIDMLDKIGYTGIANFDILRTKDSSLCLELNPRQGRSFDYTRAAGVNLAELLCADMRGENIKELFSYKDGAWRSVARRTLVRYSTDRGLLKKALMLEKNGCGVSAHDFAVDKKLSRRLYVMAHLWRENKRYARLRESTAL